MQVVFSFVRIICALSALILSSCTAISAQGAQNTTSTEWPFPAGNAGAQRNSLLTDINRCNVAQLKVV